MPSWPKLSEMDFSFLTNLLTPFLRRTGSWAGRLLGERKAGQTLFPSSRLDLIGNELDKTLNRIRGEEIEDTWVSAILTKLGHHVITPQYLKNHNIKDWLTMEEVCQDFKALATRQILGHPTLDPAIRTRLIESFDTIPTDPAATAIEAVNGIVAILVEAYQHSLQQNPVSHAGIQQAMAVESREGIEQVKQHLSHVAATVEAMGSDQHTVKAHTEQVKKVLDGIVKRRTIDIRAARTEVCALAEEVTSGELRHAERDHKAKVLYWAARLHALEPEYAAHVQAYREQVLRLDRTYDVRILDALILEHEKHPDRALQALREIDTEDGRSSLWVALKRTQGTKAAIAWFEKQPEKSQLSFFTGQGWQNVAVGLCELGQWERAAELLAAAESLEESCPDLRYIEGVINAALLLPQEFRPQALSMSIFHPSIQPLQGVTADRLRARAYICFDRAVALLSAIGADNRAGAAEHWRLWLRLTDHESSIRLASRSEVQEVMANGKRAIDYLEVALMFGIEFDQTPLRQYLASRQELGGLVGPEVLAEFRLAQISMTAREFAEFLEKEELRLATEVKLDTLAGTLVEALLKDGQIVRARDILEKRKAVFREYDYDRLKALVVLQEGGDPRSQLETLYTSTGDLVDLHNLVDHLAQVKDWRALRPLLEELFREEKTARNAHRLVECMRLDPTAGNAPIAQFLGENGDLVEISEELKSAYAWACFYLGRLNEAQRLNDELLTKRSYPGDLLLDTNLAIQSGQWDRFPLIVGREWARIDTFSAQLLLHLASLVAEADGAADRAVALAQRAVTKAPHDPQVLLNAYTLAIQLGREEAADPTWLSHALELSPPDGPVQRVDLRTLVEKIVPASRERERLLERALLRAEVPLFGLCDTLHMPLSRMLLDLPKRNAEQNDGRRRAIIPIRSGARRLMSLQGEWTIGLDMTSLLVLGHAGLLEQILSSFTKVVLAPDTMVFLLNERRRVRYHQPSQIKDAEAIREHIDKGHLKPLPVSSRPPQWLVDEVGQDLADLFETARTQNGKVVHPLPLYQLRTFHEKEADIKEYSSVILSTLDFTDLLRTGGKISHDLHGTSLAYLSTRDRSQGMSHNQDLSVLSRPLYLDDLAIAYLRGAQLLPAICRGSMDIWIHPSINQEQSALMAAGREGQRLNDQLAAIVLTLRKALDNGKAVILPKEETQTEPIPSTTGFYVDTGTCDLVCIDDRFMNRYGMLTDKKGRTVPIACSLDLINYLAEQGHITRTGYETTLHALREGGFGFAPIDPEELANRLRHAHFDGNELVESAEMRILRQYLMRLRTVEIIQLPDEALFLTQLRLSCIMAIRTLWQDESLSIDHTGALTSWVWEYISPSPLDWERSGGSHEDRRALRQKCVTYLTPLFSPLGLRDAARQDAFNVWIEQIVLSPFQSANHELFDDLADRLKIEITALVKKVAHENTSDLGS